MTVDESGAPWPYDPAPDLHANEGKPTWSCPEGICECHPPVGDAKRKPHRILFFDAEGRKMPGARCRVIEHGQLINKESPWAEADGGVPVKVRPDSRVLQVEWAPSTLPQGPGYPYRKQYYLDRGETSEEGVHRRLHNFGFSVHATLDENIRDFQRTYHRTETGRVEHVEEEVAAWHDEGKLPPVPKSEAKAKAPPVAPKPARIGGAPGGVGKAGSAAAVQMTKLRIHVRTRSGRVLKNVSVAVDFGPKSPKTGRTNALGFVLFTLTKDEVDHTQPPDWVVVTIKKRHYGPDPGPTTPAAIKASAFSASVKLEQPNPQQPYRLAEADRQPLMLKSHPGQPSILHDKDGEYLDVVLINAGLSRGAASPMTRTRRLTPGKAKENPNQVQDELMHAYVAGDITLDPASEFMFEHDEDDEQDSEQHDDAWYFGECTCKLKSPAFDKPLTLIDNVVHGIQWFGFAEKPNKPSWGLPDFKIDPANLEQSFTSHRVRVFPMKALGPIAQRNLVGVVRLCKRLRYIDTTEITAIYTQGVTANGANSPHGPGLACDFGGCSTKLPTDASRQGVEQASSSREITFKVALGVDFIVWYHWGLIPQWDPTTVAAAPWDRTTVEGNRGAPNSWKRLPWDKPDSGVNFEDYPDGKGYRNAYRLDPPPLQTPSGTKLAEHFKLASDVFRAVYSFAVQEYTDAKERDAAGNETDPSLGPLPVGRTEPEPTPIDAQTGHMIEHPDYGAYAKGMFDGRFAHRNHLHFQLGPTRPKPGVR